MISEYLQYCKDTFDILRNNFYLLLIPSILTTGLYVSQLETKNQPIDLFLIVTFLIFIILPLIYGQYIEIILHGKTTSWRAVFTSYWLRFVTVIILVNIPTFLFILLFPRAGEVKNSVSNLIELLSIYIFPLVFLKKEIINSIKLGIKCLFGNLKFSSPLIIIAAVTYFWPELDLGFYKYTDTKFLIYISYFLFVLINVATDLFIFIAASLILKDKFLLTNNLD